MTIRKSQCIPLLFLASLPAVGLAEQIKIAGTAVELVLSQVTERTVRLDILPLDDQGQPKPTPPSMVLEPFASREVKRFRDSSELPAGQAITVGTIPVMIKSGPLVFSFYKPAGAGGGGGAKLLQEITVKDADGSVVFRTEAPTFGLGEGRQQFDRRGFYYDFRNGQNTLLATHGATMPVPFLFGMDGWGMFVHNPPPAVAPQPNTAWVQFDLRGEDLPPPTAGRGGRGGAPIPTTAPTELPTRGRFIPRQDTLNQAPTSIFIMNLDKPTDAFGEYTHLFGKPAMPPKWAMGYMQSHRSLASSDEVLAVAKKLRDDQIPCDALIYLGTGYTNATQANQPYGGWNIRNGSLEFNTLLFPPEMIGKLHGLDYKVILHKTNAPANLHGSVGEEPDGPTHIAAYWATHVPLMKLGVDAWWPDDGDELPIENRLARIKAYWDGPLKDRPNERPWSLDRNGYAGVAKYGGWNWSGDVQSRWATLAAHVPDGVQFSLCVSPWWGTDIGGFNASPTNEYTGELYTRWFEFGAFNPLFRSHGRNWHLHTPFGWNTGETGPVESRPAPPESELHNAQVEPICKKYDDLRYQLLPYNYTITREACDTGMPLMRALLLVYPNDPEAVKLGDEYLWGPSILVAPVVEKGATERKVYLPEGEWYDYWTGEKMAGKRWITRPVDLSIMPIYVKAGAVIPMDPVRQFTAQPASEPTTLHVYAGANSTVTLYDDDGHTMGYLNNSDPQMQWIRVTYDDGAKTVTLDMDARMKAWPAGTARTFKVQMGNSGAGKVVEFRGQHVEVRL